MKRKNGLTLAEIMIVLLVSSIIVAIAFSVFAASWRIYRISQETALLSRNLRSLVERISEEFRWATEIEFTSSPQGSGWIVILLESSTIKRFQGTTSSRTNEQNMSDPSQVSVSSLTFALRTVQDNRVMMDVSITASSATNSSITESVSTSVAVYNLRNLSGSGSAVSYKK
jgi:prepilin-type N-terminal cleavage/methylation domain-containing protein